MGLFGSPAMRNSQPPSLSCVQSPRKGKSVVLSTGMANPLPSRRGAAAGSDKSPTRLEIWSCAGGTGDFVPGSQKG